MTAPRTKSAKVLLRSVMDESYTVDSLPMLTTPCEGAWLL